MSDAPCCLNQGTWFPHPDLIQTVSIQATQGTRRYVYGGSAYLLYARVTGINGATGLAVEFFTTEEPDAEAADVNIGNLSQDSYRGHEDAPDVPFPNGIYFKVTGPTALEECLVEIAWVSRKDYCRAYAKPQSFLQCCWSLACGRKDTPWLDNFDEGDADDGAWDNDGASTGSGGPGPGEFVDSLFRILYSADTTAQMAFDVSAITPTATRTILMPDANVDLSNGGMANAVLQVNPIPTAGTMRTGTSSTNSTLTPALVKATNLFAMQHKTANYTILDTDEVVSGDATAGSFTLTLFPATGNDGRSIYVKRTDGSGNSILIATPGTETIDGVSTKTLSPGKSMRIVSDGTNFLILSAS